MVPWMLASPNIWPDSKCVWQSVLSLRVAKIWSVRGGSSIPTPPGRLKILGLAQKSTKSPVPWSCGKQRGGAARGDGPSPSRLRQQLGCPLRWVQDHPVATQDCWTRGHRCLVAPQSSGTGQWPQLPQGPAAGTPPKAPNVLPLVPGSVPFPAALVGVSKRSRM